MYCIDNTGFILEKILSTLDKMNEQFNSDIDESWTSADFCLTCRGDWMTYGSPGNGPSPTVRQERKNTTFPGEP